MVGDDSADSRSGNPNGDFMTTLSLNDNITSTSASFGSLVKEEVDYALPATNTAGIKAALLLVLTATDAVAGSPDDGFIFMTRNGLGTGPHLARTLGFRSAARRRATR